VSYTKATVADVDAAEAAATDTGAAASESGASATEFANQMQSGIDEISQALLAHFRQVADGLRQEARRATQQLTSTDWEGQSKEMAVQAEQTLHSRLDATMAAAEEGTTEFNTVMSQQATDFVALVREDFNQIMGNVDVAFQDLATAERTFAENLRLTDETVRFGD
jgi:DNA-binding LacI/PurR family transcriptional regulator